MIQIFTNSITITAPIGIVTRSFLYSEPNPSRTLTFGRTLTVPNVSSEGSFPSLQNTAGRPELKAITINSTIKSTSGFQLSLCSQIWLPDNQFITLNLHYTSADFVGPYRGSSPQCFGPGAHPASSPLNNFSCKTLVSHIFLS